MDAERAEDMRKLSLYDPDTAGGLIELEVFSFHGDEVTLKTKTGLAVIQYYSQ